jgi:metal-responsive CopG/Arc/MetJ family transcriptional regulator
MQRLSLSLPEELAGRIREAARAEGDSLSGWLARAAEQQLRLRNAAHAIAEWERQHGAISAGELARVERAWRA